MKHMRDDGDDHSAVCYAQAQRRLLRAGACWVLAVAHWLGWAYLLEFQGLPMHLGVWAAGVVSLAANVGLLCALQTVLRPRSAKRLSRKRN